MRWVLRLIETGVTRTGTGIDAMVVSRPDGAGSIGDLGLTLSEAKQPLAGVQQAIVPRASGRSCGSATTVSALWWSVSRQRLAVPCARDSIRQGGGTATTILLHQLRSPRALCHLATSLSIDA
jgi:hypothetical protein